MRRSPRKGPASCPVRRAAPTGTGRPTHHKSTPSTFRRSIGRPRSSSADPKALKLTPGTPFLGSSNAFGDQDPISQRLGHVTAVDADSGKVLWKYDADTSMVASVTPTAGGLVLTGDTKGNFLAFDAKDGKVLLKKPLGDPIGGGIVTYEIGGVQYVAVAGGMKNTVTQQTDSGPAWVAILSVAKQ